MNVLYYFLVVCYSVLNYITVFSFFVNGLNICLEY